MKSTPFVSIIVPSYNRSDLIGITLASFLAQSYGQGNFEIIVSDNNSKDNTKDVVMKFVASHPGVVSYIFEPRQGVHYARNTAAKKAKGELLYFTDDDMIAHVDLIKELVRVFELDPEIGTATGLVVGKFDVPPPEWVRKHLINSYLSLTDQYRAEELIVSVNDVGVYSCHQAIIREAFFSSGGFNPENTAGTWVGDGETGLNIKLKALNYKFAYTSKSVTYHIIPKERTNLSYLVKRIGNQGFCDAYTEYRQHRKIEITILRMFTRNFFVFPKHLLGELVRIFKGKASWHFLLAKIAYFHKHNVYDFRLIRRPDFRAIVEIDDWLRNDIGFKFD